MTTIARCACVEMYGPRPATASGWQTIAGAFAPMARQRTWAGNTRLAGRGRLRLASAALLADGGMLALPAA